MFRHIAACLLRMKMRLVAGSEALLPSQSSIFVRLPAAQSLLGATMYPAYRGPVGKFDLRACNS